MKLCARGLARARHSRLELAELHYVRRVGEDAFAVRHDHGHAEAEILVWTSTHVVVPVSLTPSSSRPQPTA